MAGVSEFNCFGSTGSSTDEGAAWISVVSFNRSWQTATWHGKTLRRDGPVRDELLRH